MRTRTALRSLLHSATTASWAAAIARLLSFGLVFPFVVTTLPEAQIALWYLFGTVMGLQLLADMGFSGVFVRFISYASGGNREFSGRQTNPERQVGVGPDWESIGRIVASMRRVYIRLAVGWLVCMGAFGTWASVDLFASAGQCRSCWLAWTVVLLGTTVRVYGAKYSAVLLGANRVALVRYTEAATWLGASVGGVLAILLEGGLFALTAVFQLAMLLCVLALRHWAQVVEGGRLWDARSALPSEIVISDAWSAAWRAGLGLAMAAGVVQGSGLVFARLGTTREVAAYLMALNVMGAAAAIARAPFYSKIPRFTRLHAQGLVSERNALAQKGMRWSHWTFVLVVYAVALLMAPTLSMLASNVEFVSQRMWALMCVGFFLERYGAMHLQLYTTTNHVLWHVANGVAGLIYIATATVTFSKIGMFAFPLAHMLGSVFYAAYAAARSTQAFGLHLGRFELHAAAIPAFLIAALAVTSYLLG